MICSTYAETLSVLPCTRPNSLDNVSEELDEELVEELLDVLLEELSVLSRLTTTASSFEVELELELEDELWGGGSPFFMADCTLANALCAAERSFEFRALPNAAMAVSMPEVALELEVELVPPDWLTCCACTFSMAAKAVLAADKSPEFKALCSFFQSCAIWLMLLVLLLESRMLLMVLDEIPLIDIAASLCVL